MRCEVMISHEYRAIYIRLYKSGSKLGFAVCQPPALLKVARSAKHSKLWLSTAGLRAL